MGQAGVRVAIGPGRSKQWSLGQAGVRVVIGPGRSKSGHWARQE